MLIYCKECEHACSEHAAVCPQCGGPLKPPQDHQYRDREGAGDGTTTTQLTAKRYKAMQLIGAGCLCLGIPMVCIPDANPTVVTGLILSGLVIYIYARIAAWWHHG